MFHIELKTIGVAPGHGTAEADDAPRTAVAPIRFHHMTVIIAENGILTVRELVQNVGARIEFARSKLVRKTAARPKTGAPQDTRVAVDVHAHAAVGIVIVTLQERGLNLHLRFDEESRFMTELLCLSGRPRSDRRPIKLSVVNRHAIDPWRFPPRFEYMFGEWLRTDMENGTVPQPFSDPDNVLLLWQARLHAIPLTAQSPAIDKLIAPIPFEEIRRVIRGALPNVLSSYKGDERNVLLTLSRMWYTLDTGKFPSKDQATLWAEGKVPAEHASLLRLARDAYLGNRSDRWDDQEYNVLCLLAFMRRAVMHAIGRKSSETDTLSGVDP